MAHTIAADRVSYTDLYARWEQGNWRATEIDFATDREQWRDVFTELERRSALWTYSMFFHGEDSVADNLSPFIEGRASPGRAASCACSPARHGCSRKRTLTLL